MWPFDPKADASAETGEHPRRSDRSQETDTDLPTGYETPGKLVENAKLDGEAYGAARIEPDIAFGPTSGPFQRIEGGSDARKGILRRDHYNDRIPAAQRVSTRENRKSASAERRNHLIVRLKVLVEQRLPQAIQERQRAKDELAYEREGLEELPRHRQGYFTSFWHVMLVEVLVVAYDAAVLSPALKHSGLGLEGNSLLYMSIATPLAILAVNYGLGLLAGAFVLRVPSDWRPRIALMVLAAGFTGLLVTFLLLAIFRADATVAHNHAINSIANGEPNTSLSFFINPWWFGPLQVVGSLAAISVMALYVAGGEGRRQGQVLASSRDALAQASGKVVGVEEEIESVRRQIAQAAVAMHEIDADAAAARSEIVLSEQALAAEMEAENGLRDTAKAAFRFAYIYNEKIFNNGKIWRAAQETLKRNNQVRTPMPEDKEVPSQEPPYGPSRQRSFEDELARYGMR